MLKKICLTTGTCVLFFLLLEGICSTLLVAGEMLAPEHRTLSGRAVQYDPELGWSTVPNFNDKNYYAPDVDLRINSRGFRASEEFTQQIPPGKVRIICSGDSQTFGDGVGNDQTWCQDLESLNQRIQPVNMGGTGYGVDQMYLWYKRQGVGLDHNIHVFALHTDNFRRMPFAVLGGYGKPVLKLQNGEIATTNVPVPRRSRFLQWMALKPHPLREFRSLAAMAWLAGRLAPPRDSAFSNGPTDEQSRLIGKVFEDLQAKERQKNSLLVLVYLPERVADYGPGGASPAWRKWVREECAKRGIALVDLVDDFQKLPITMKDGFFIWPGATLYFAEGPGHFDVQGQQWVAGELYPRLISMPEVAEKLAIHSRARTSR